MKKLLPMLLALAMLFLSASALAEDVAYDDPAGALAFVYDDNVFEIEADDDNGSEHLVVLNGTQEDWGDYFISLYVRELAEDELFPTLDDYAELEEGLNTEVTQGEWNGFQDVILYTVQDDASYEQVCIVPLAVADSLMTVDVKVELLEDEEASMARDDAISAVLDTLSISFDFDDAEAFDIDSLQIAESPEWVTSLPQAQDESVQQLFVVAGMGMDLTTATISMHERDDEGNWMQLLSTPGFVGKNGLCLDEDHAEGCAQTPIGVYNFNKAFGIAADPGCALPYIQVDDDIYWSGDPEYHYNEMMNINDYPELAMDDSEHIVDYTYQYQYCLNISFNEEGTPGRGSAIFLHCFGPTKPYTGGCVAIPQNIMELVMQNVSEDCVVVIDTVENLGVTF